jgi:hypothetical protein
VELAKARIGDFAETVAVEHKPMPCVAIRRIARFSTAP